MVQPVLEVRYLTGQRLLALLRVCELLGEALDFGCLLSNLGFHAGTLGSLVLQRLLAFTKRRLQPVKLARLLAQLPG